MSAFLLTSHKYRLLSMKILTSEQIRHIDTETASRQGIPSLELMKRAARAFFNRFVELFPDKNTSVLILAGMGNNGGDGLDEQHHPRHFQATCRRTGTAADEHQA